MEGVIALISVISIGLFGFMIYYVFKQIQFFLTATKLYQTMIEKQDTAIKLLIDIRDNTKSVNVESVEYQQTNIGEEEYEQIDDAWEEEYEATDVEEEDIGEPVPKHQYTLQAWLSRKDAIMKALDSDNLSEQGWALNELEMFSNNRIEEAKEIFDKYNQAGNGED